MAMSKGIVGAGAPLEMRTPGYNDAGDKQAKSHDARDKVELTRTGKKPVLKVCAVRQSLTSLLLG